MGRILVFPGYGGQRAHSVEDIQKKQAENSSSTCFIYADLFVAFAVQKVFILFSRILAPPLLPPRADGFHNGGRAGVQVGEAREACRPFYEGHVLVCFVFYGLQEAAVDVLQQGQIGLLISSRKGQETGRVVRNAAKGRQAGQLRQVPAFIAQRRQSDWFGACCGRFLEPSVDDAFQKSKERQQGGPLVPSGKELSFRRVFFVMPPGSSFKGLVVLPQLLVHRGLQYIDVAVLKDRDVDLRFHSSFILST